MQLLGDPAERCRRDARHDSPVSGANTISFFAIASASGCEKLARRMPVRSLSHTAISAGTAVNAMVSGSSEKWPFE
jgi:hypothetical protein